MTSFETALEGITEADPLQKVRYKAWDHFLELGWPTKQTEVYRYVPLRKFYERDFVPAVRSEADLSGFQGIVFVNGYYEEKLSTLPEGVVVTSLNEATHTYGAYLNTRWAKTMKEETDSLAALNAALHPHGVFIYVPPKMVLKEPLRVLNILRSGFAMPRIHVFAGRHAEITLISENESSSDTCLNQVFDLHLEEEAKVKLYQSHTKHADDVWVFDAVRAHLKRNSLLETVSATKGAETVRQDYSVTLTQENSEVRLNGISMLESSRQAHTNVLVEHQAPNCRSMQLFKSVLNDCSRSSFEGKILVRQAAQQTNAFQLNNNLLLSDQAHADSKPNLEIFADDVKASHGATIGQLDKEEMFYMRTRGLSEKMAKNLLIDSFCKEVIDETCRQII